MVPIVLLKTGHFMIETKRTPVCSNKTLQKFIYSTKMKIYYELL